MKLGAIAAGGAIGAVLRYAVSGIAYRLGGTSFPWGTLAVNVAGSLVIGLLWGLTEGRPMPSKWTAFLFIGVLGAFTTFSTFSIESVRLFRDGEIGFGVLNVLANNIGAIGAVVIGFMAGRFILQVGR